MKKLATVAALIAALAVANCTVSTATTAKALPDCDNAEVRKLVTRIFRAERDQYQQEGPLYGQAKDLKSEGGKRWCTARAYIPVSEAVVYSSGWGWDKRIEMDWRNVTYTIEWINEAEGRFWVEAK
jgi:hypothetical protein